MTDTSPSPVPDESPAPAVSRVTRTELLEADQLPPLKSVKGRLLRGLAIIVVFGVLGLLGGLLGGGP